MEEKHAISVDRLKELRTKGIYNVHDIMDIFGISDSTVYRWVKDKKLKPSKIGKKLFFRKGHIEYIIKKNLLR